MTLHVEVALRIYLHKLITSTDYITVQMHLREMSPDPLKSYSYSCCQTAEVIVVKSYQGGDTFVFLVQNEGGSCAMEQ